MMLLVVSLLLKGNKVISSFRNPKYKAVLYSSELEKYFISEPYDSNSSILGKLMTPESSLGHSAITTSKKFIKELTEDEQEYIWVIIGFIQFSGILDKNGEELYESDLCNIFIDDETQEVVFKNGAFGYMTGGKYSYFVSFAGNTNFNINDSMWLDIEKVGNSYENQNLQIKK